MKVYLVTSGTYSDYGVEAIFLDRQNAEAYCAARDTHSNCYDLHSIEEWDNSDGNISVLPNSVVYVWRADKNSYGEWCIGFYKYGIAGIALPQRRKGSIFFSTRKNDKAVAQKTLYDILAKRVNK